MIEDLRFVEREVNFTPTGFDPAPNGYGLKRKQKILQAYDGHVWFDVPFVGEEK